MLSADDIAKVYDTILSIPGMNETVKIDLKITRKNALLLNRVIERGLSLKDAENGSNLLDKVSEETLEEMNYFNPIPITRKKIMELAHVNSIVTYHKCIKQLQKFGYIHYLPSYNRYSGTQVLLVAIPD